MKIEISQIDLSATRGYNIWYDDKPLRNYRQSIFVRDFDEDEILYILGDKEYAKFEEGKYIFNIPKWKIYAIIGEPNPIVFNDNLRLQWQTEYYKF